MNFCTTCSNPRGPHDQFPPSGTRRDREIRRKQHSSYGLHLLLRTGKRITVMNHADDESIEQDGKTVSQSLRVQLWNVL